MSVRVLAAFAGLLAVSGCAIHPVPEDVTGVNTYHIVRQIRCETREALKDLIIERLDALARHGDAVAQGLLLQYQSEPESIATFRPSLFRGPEYVQVRSIFGLFLATGIAYTFDLTMTEDNDLTTEINLVKALTTPNFTLGINAGAKRRRSNERTFTVTDSFGDLLARLNTPVRGQRYCDRQIVTENYIYPIAGRVGIDKTVKTFMELTVFANLAQENGKPGVAGPPTMTDKLTFTTTVNISATPKIEFTPVTSQFQLANASLTASAMRTDQHQVTVGLALPTLADLSPFRSYVFSADRGPSATGGGGIVRRALVAPSLYVGLRVTGGGSEAERLAVKAIDQIKSRELQIIGPQ